MSTKSNGPFLPTINCDRCSKHEPVASVKALPEGWVRLLGVSLPGLDLHLCPSCSAAPNPSPVKRTPTTDPQYHIAYFLSTPHALKARVKPGWQLWSVGANTLSGPVLELLGIIGGVQRGLPVDANQTTFSPAKDFTEGHPVRVADITLYSGYASDREEWLEGAGSMEDLLARLNGHVAATAAREAATRARQARIDGLLEEIQYHREEIIKRELNLKALRDG